MVDKLIVLKFYLNYNKRYGKYHINSAKSNKKGF